MPTAIIYAAESRAVRSIVVDGDEAKLASFVGRGEGIIIVGEDVEGHAVVRTVRGDEQALFKGRYPDLDECNALVERVTGEKPADSRCVVLDGERKVACVIMADPLLDATPEGDVIREPEALLGDELKDDGLFYREHDGQLKSLEQIKIDEAAKAPEADAETEAAGKAAEATKKPAK